MKMGLVIEVAGSEVRLWHDGKLLDTLSGSQLDRLLLRIAQAINERETT